MTKTMSLHGVLMRIQGIGVLIGGPSGIGKSEAALGLIDRGAQLVADDAPLFRNQQDSIIGHCSPALQGKLQVHGLGVLDLAQLYGSEVICPQVPLELIICLSDQPQPKSHQAINKQRSVLLKDIPEIVIPVNQPRNCALLIDCVVRTYLVAKKGYNAPLNLEQN